MCWYFPDSKHPSNLASGHSTKMTIFNSKILNEGQEYLILKLLKNWKLFMCKEVLNTILTINSSETLLWWLLALNDYNAASIDWSIVDPGVSYPADNIRIDSIYSCVKVWSWTKLWWGMIYNKQWKPAAITPPPIMWVTQLRRQQTDTAWLSLDGRWWGTKPASNVWRLQNSVCELHS